MSPRRKRLAAVSAALLVGLALATPWLIGQAVRGALLAGLAGHGFTVSEGEVELSPLRGKGRVSGLRLERDDGRARLEIRIEQGSVDYGVCDALGDPPRLAQVDAQGVRVHLVRREPSGQPAKRPRRLQLESVTVRDLELRFEDYGPETTEGEPFGFDVQVSEGSAENVWLDDVVRTALLETHVRGSVGGGELELERGELEVRGAELAPFSTYLTHVAPLELTAGQGAIDARIRGTEDGGLEAWIYLEVTELDVAAISAGASHLIRDLSLDALVAYLRRRGVFFAHAFRAEVPGRELDGVPAHDVRAVGVAVSHAFVRSLVDDRLDPRRPTPRPVHPALRSPRALFERLRGLEPEGRDEVFAGALRGRLFEGWVVEVEATGESWLGLGKPFVVGDVDGLRVRVQKLSEPEAVGSRSFATLVAVELEQAEDGFVLVLEPADP